MQNSTSLSIGLVQMNTFNSKTLEIGRAIFLSSTLLSFFYFLYFIVGILHFSFTSPHVREQPRYILFAHMLINDALYLSLSLFLLMASLFLLYIPVPICYIIVTLTSSTFKITPYNLAVMALERYAAICFPLRHAILCTPQRSNVAIAVMWTIGLIPNVADLVVLGISADRKFISLRVMCTREAVMVNAIQSSIRSYTLISSLATVAVIILFTYVKVMLVARKISSGSSSAFKAGRTVMLHAFQLLLCMVSFTSAFTESYFREYLLFLLFGNFIILTCLPRFLSPLIYGLRDEVLKQGVRRLFTPNCKSLKSWKFRSNKCKREATQQ
uniref:G-protein coupled receptors family 1 profile domain-containing protein n=1 Tax=Leptobrachium leishanense TaxID=445787 RepID=A0A8C5LRY8_9ANUR